MNIIKCLHKLFENVPNEEMKSFSRSENKFSNFFPKKICTKLNTIDYSTTTTELFNYVPKPANIILRMKSTKTRSLTESL